MTVSFQTNTLKSRRKAIIDGHEYTVRRLGNIEQLEISRLQAEIQAIFAKYPTDVKDEDVKPEDLLTVNEKAERMSKLILNLFDDGTEDQEHSRKLVESLTDGDIFDILSKVFEEK